MCRSSKTFFFLDSRRLVGSREVSHVDFMESVFVEQNYFPSKSSFSFLNYPLSLFNDYRSHPFFQEVCHSAMSRCRNKPKMKSTDVCSILQNVYQRLKF